MHFTYKKKIFLYFLIVFTIFTVIIVAVQQNREKMYKSENFKASLNAYAEIIANYVDSHRLIADKRLDSLNNLLPLLPRGLRVSIIDRQGKVLYDNDIDEEETVENHLSRPEIAQALTQSNGTNIRKSETTGIDYYYDARLFNNYFVRVALPYTDQVQNILKADEIFTYFILLLFFTTLISLLYLADRFGKAVSGLNEFIITAEHSQPDYDKIDFPDTELGEIGHKIVDNYKMLKKSKDQLNQEREKLLRHFHHSDEGICIFSADHKKIYANTHFIQYVNTILDEPTFDVDHIFQAPEFKEAEFFLQKNTPVNPQAKSIPIWQGKIAKNGKHFAVRLLIFYDNSYEITLNNVTSAEKNRLLKQEMTNNIAHELKNSGQQYPRLHRNYSRTGTPGTCQAEIFPGEGLYSNSSLIRINSRRGFDHQNRRSLRPIRERNDQYPNDHRRSDHRPGSILTTQSHRRSQSYQARKLKSKVTIPYFIPFSGT